MKRLAQAAGLVLAATGLAVVAACAEVALYGRRSSDGPADAAIVLGAAVLGDMPSPVFMERIRHAVTLHRGGRVRKLLVTGGLGKGDRVTEADAARRWAMSQGVPNAGILAEDRSRTTAENLANALPILLANGLSRVLIVSDPPHMRRAMLIADRIGLDAAPSPTLTSRYTGWRSWSGFVIREAYFMTRCRLTGRC